MTRWFFTAAAVLLAAGNAFGQDKVEIKAKEWGSLSGKVVYKGEPPPVKSLVPNMKVHPDGQGCCLLGTPFEKIDHTWIVDPKTKGVANVVVYLRPANPKAEYLPIHAEDKVRKDTVTLDQPHCMFLPHLLTLYPSYFNGVAQVPTGQKFAVKNSAKVPHNINAVGNPVINPGFNVLLAPGDVKEFNLKAQAVPMTLSCNLHPWMQARAVVFDHPYVALTKADGTFTIPRVPAGVGLVLMAWHEEPGYVVSDELQGSKGRAVMFKAGENSFDFTITAKKANP